MLTAGIDLAAEPAKTAIAVIQWGPADAVVQCAQAKASDEDILRAVPSSDWAGIDCPLGWPDVFVDFVTAHREGSVPPVRLTDSAWKDTLSYRLTDFEVQRVTGRRPLSVSANLIGRTAMRAAAILTQMAAEGTPVDRAGGGRVIEVYPAAALRSWGLPFVPYKGDDHAVARGLLVDALQTALPGLRLEAFEDVMRSSDHVLDAVMCALVARAHGLGNGSRPAEVDRGQAEREGWIVLPTCDLAGLVEEPR